MATCSITDRIVINNPEFVDAYIDAMEARANAPFKPRTEDQKSACITDPEEIGGSLNYAWQIQTINILDSIDENGLEKTKAALAKFSTKRSNRENSLNEDIEIFLKNNAIQFAKEKKSITYLVLDIKKGILLGYFTLAHKTIEIPESVLSKTKKKRIERYARFNETLNAYPVSAFLIAQFGKNYALDEG